LFKEEQHFDKLSANGFFSCRRPRPAFRRKTVPFRERLGRQNRSSVMIRKLKSGQYRLYSRKKDEATGKRRNLGTFDTRAAAEKHEREVQYFKKRG